MAATSAPAIAKPKRFRFSTEFDIALLRCISSNGAHLAALGKTEEKFTSVLTTFLATPEFLSRSANVPPFKLKTVRDRFKELVKERRVVVKRKVAASGIAEEHGEMEQLLDSIIEEVDDKAQVLAEQIEPASTKREESACCY